MHQAADQNTSLTPSAVDDGLHFLAYPEHLLLATLNDQGQCDFVSPSWTGFTGRTPVQEVGVGWQDRVHQEDLANLQRGLQTALRDQKAFRLLFRYQRCDGVHRWLVGQGTARMAAGGQFCGHIALCFDVTAYQEGALPEAGDTARNMVALLQQTRLVAVLLDAQGCVQFANEGLCRLLECSATELIGRALFDRHLLATQRHWLDSLYPQGRQNAHYPAEFETGLTTCTQGQLQVAWHAMALRDFANQPKGVVLIGEDMTALRRTEAHLALSSKIFEASHHAMVVTQLDGSIVAVNDAFTQLTGYGKDEVLGKNPRILQSGRHEPGFYGQLWEQLLSTGHWSGDVWDRNKNGEVYPKYLSISVIKDASGQATHYAGIFYEISERKKFEERLDRLAHYDALTGLPNRSLLVDRLEQAAERADRQQTRMGLLYLDLDHFKEVNDTLGHAAGDQMLKAMAQRLKACVRGVDTVARLGGDEFVVVVSDVTRPDDLIGVVNQIRNALSEPYALEGQLLVSAPSIGISIYPDDSRDIDQLLKYADAAMYRVKQSGRANFQFFSASD